jgi:hypothetical protein
MNTVRKIALTTLRLGIAYFAFSLSFVAQTTLAHASGITTDLAWQYPLIVDAAILFGMLVDAWSNNGLTKGQRQYLYLAIGFWTTTSILGNAFHLTALPTSLITVPIALAIAVNTIPGITLFLMIHLSSRLRPTRTTSTTPARKRPPTTHTDQTEQTPRSQPYSARTRSVRDDLPSPAELLERSLAGETYAEIGLSIGMGKSWVGDRVKAEREARDALVG